MPGHTLDTTNASSPGFATRFDGPPDTALVHPDLRELPSGRA